MRRWMGLARGRTAGWRRRVCRGGRGGRRRRGGLGGPRACAPWRRRRASRMDPSLIDGLRAALAATPGNQALRRLLAKALLDHRHFAEAEREYRLALEASPADDEARLGLARVFAAQGKTSAALVICEAAAADGEAA